MHERGREGERKEGRGRGRGRKKRRRVTETSEIYMSAPKLHHTLFYLVFLIYIVQYSIFWLVFQVPNLLH